MVGADWRETQCSSSAEGDSVPGVACRNSEEGLVKGGGGRRKEGGAAELGRLFEERFRCGVTKVQKNKARVRSQ